MNPELTPQAQHKLECSHGHIQNGNLIAAETALLEALILQPEHPALLFALANCYAECGKTQEAEFLFAETLAKTPTFPYAAHNFGVLLQGQDRFSEAITLYLSELNVHPEHGPTWRHFSQALLATGETALSIETLEKATKLFPDDRETRFALALAYLKTGNWRKGWPLYETRWKRQELPPGPLEIRPWQGEPIKNTSILVTAEQGLGDCILFSRYLGHLAEHAQNIQIWIPPPLWRIFDSSFSKYGVTILKPGDPRTGFDFRIPFGSLPLALLFEDEIRPPHQIPYIHPDPTADAKITELLGNWKKGRPNTLTAGIVWRGRTEYAADNKRSTSLELLLSKCSAPNTQLLSLQINPTESDLLLMKQHGIPDFSPLLTDLHATASIISMLDMVISVDTATANIAGAMGKPLTIVQRQDSDWRWGMDRRGTDWFSDVSVIPLF